MMAARHTGDFPTTPEVCALHLDQTAVLAGIRSDVKWLLRLGYGVTLVAAALIGLLYPYFSTLNHEMTALQAQMLVNTRQLAVLGEADQRSEADRLVIHKSIEELQKCIPQRK